MAPDVSDETAAVIDQMLRPEPADRQSSYKELIAQMEAARSAILAREEELRGRWSWPMRVLVSLGALLGVGAICFRDFFGLRHLPQQERGADPKPGAGRRVGNARRQSAGTVGIRAARA